MRSTVSSERVLFKNRATFLTPPSRSYLKRNDLNNNWLRFMGGSRRDNGRSNWDSSDEMRRKNVRQAGRELGREEAEQREDQKKKTEWKAMNILVQHTTTACNDV